MITASIASIPEREPVLKQSLLTIAPQVDRLNICLNGYTRVPAFIAALPSAVEVVLGNNAKGCGAKFLWAASVEGYI